ncbi:MAG: M56 family metallopeptidase [Planctomycetota bacterium]
MLGWLLHHLRSFQRTVRSAPAAPPDLCLAVAAVAQRLRVRPPPVHALEGIGSPAIWCLGRPRLLWPASGADRGTPPRPASLIAHELAYLARHDHWVSRLEVLAIVLCWWNPLFWIIRRQVHVYAELSCDAWATWAYPAERRSFETALIGVQERTASATVALHGLCAFTTELRNFERRLNMIIHHRMSKGVSRGAAAWRSSPRCSCFPASPTRRATRR